MTARAGHGGGGSGRGWSSSSTEDSTTDEYASMLRSTHNSSVFRHRDFLSQHSLRLGFHRGARGGGQCGGGGGGQCWGGGGGQCWGGGGGIHPGGCGRRVNRGGGCCDAGGAGDGRCCHRRLRGLLRRQRRRNVALGGCVLLLVAGLVGGGGLLGGRYPESLPMLWGGGPPDTDPGVDRVGVGETGHGGRDGQPVGGAQTDTPSTGPWGGGPGVRGQRCPNVSVSPESQHVVSACLGHGPHCGLDLDGLCCLLLQMRKELNRRTKAFDVALQSLERQPFPEAQWSRSDVAGIRGRQPFPEAQRSRSDMAGIRGRQPFPEAQRSRSDVAGIRATIYGHRPSALLRLFASLEPDWRRGGGGLRWQEYTGRSSVWEMGVERLEWDDVVTAIRIVSNGYYFVYCRLTLRRHPPDNSSTSPTDNQHLAVYRNAGHAAGNGSRAQVLLLESQSSPSGGVHVQGVFRLVKGDTVSASLADHTALDIHTTGVGFLGAFRV